MLQAGKIKPEARVYYEKIAQLWEEIGDRFATANWLSFLGDTEKAKRLYKEEAEECLSVDEKFDKYRAVLLFKMAGEEQRANDLVSELIKDDLSRGDKYDAAALHKQYGDKDEARRLFLENAKELERQESSLPENSKENGLAGYWARRAYEEAGAEDEVRRMIEADIKEVVEITGDPDSPFIAFNAERLGEVERAKRAYRKLAELYGKNHDSGAGSNSMGIALSATLYAKAGDTEKAEEMFRKAAKVAENHESDVRQAIVLYAKLKDETEVKRLLEESVVEAKNKNDKKTLADGLVDLWFLDKSPERLEKTKNMYLEYAKEMEVSPDPEAKENAIYAYRMAADIVNGTLQPMLEFYWGKS